MEAIQEGGLVVPGKGRPPKSTDEKRRAGNPGQRPLNEDEPEPESGCPPMPPHMEFDAAETWTWLCGQLEHMGIAATSDLAIMMAYCDTTAEYLEARRKVEDEGLTCTGAKGGEYMNPAFSAELALRKQLVGYAIDLGLTPLSRSRIHAAPPKAPANGKTKGFNLVG